MPKGLRGSKSVVMCSRTAKSVGVSFEASPLPRGLIACVEFRVISPYVMPMGLWIAAQEKEGAALSERWPGYV